MPAIIQTSESAESSSTVGLTCPFSALGLSAVSKMVGAWSDDVVGRASSSMIRSRATLCLESHLLGIRYMEHKPLTFMHSLVSASDSI